MADPKNLLNPSTLSQVEAKYKNSFNAIDSIVETIEGLDNSFLALSGGALTGDVTTSNTTFGNTSLVTKSYVDTNSISEAIVDVETLPTGSNIKDVIYRAPSSGDVEITVGLDAVNTLQSLGFTVESNYDGSGWEMKECYPPSGVTCTCLYNDTEYTVSHIVITENGEEPGTFAYGYLYDTEEVDTMIDENDTLILSGLSSGYAYYLGNSESQTTTELVIGNGSTGDNYMLKTGTNNSISTGNVDNDVLIGTAVLDLTANPPLNGSASIKLHTNSNNSKLTLHSGSYTGTLDLILGTYTELDENDDPVSYSGLFLNDVNNDAALFAVNKASSKLLFTGSQVEFGTGDTLGNNYKFTIGTTDGSGGTDSSAVFTLGYEQAAYNLILDVNESASLSGNLAFRIAAKTVGNSPTSHPIEFGSKLLSTQTTAASFTNDNEFVTKLYVDDAIEDIDLSGYVPIDGGSQVSGNKFTINRAWTKNADQISFGLSDSNGAAFIQLSKNSSDNLYDLQIGLSGSNDQPVIRLKNGKAHYIKTSGTTLSNDNEIAVKGDITTPDMSDYVTATAYNTLLNSYNDLVERLNEFLINTSTIDADTYFVTKSLSSATLILRQDTDAAVTIDWGDGITSTTTGKGSNIYSEFEMTHTYSVLSTYVITVTKAIPAAKFLFHETMDASQFIEVKLTGGVGFTFASQDPNTTIKKYTIDNYPTVLGGESGTPYLGDMNGLKEMIIGANIGTLSTIINSSTTLAKATIGCGSSTGVGDDPDTTISLFKDCPNLKELHFTATTPLVLGDNTLFNTIPNDLVIYVPTANVNDYKTAWSTYASYIQGE